MPQIKPHPALTFQQESSQLILGMDPLFINAEVCQFAEFRGEGKKWKKILIVNGKISKNAKLKHKKLAICEKVISSQGDV